ncbi:MAG: paraquat-inducible protein A, partial [Cycloclasticus sp.]
MSLDAVCSERTTGQGSGLYVCHACDALQNIAAVKPGAVAKCVCCGSTLLRNPNGGGERPLALLIAAAILFFISNIYPIMDIKIAGIEQSTTLTGAAMIFVEL